uniref:Transporter n=1 Tax=Rhabditophanes sp. KR3021 TaxID=114890 RepID=A0AC35TRX3_9BILA
MIRQLTYLGLFCGSLVPVLFSNTFNNSFQVIVAFFGAFVWTISLGIAAIIWRFGSMIFENILFYSIVAVLLQQIGKIGFYYAISLGEQKLVATEKSGKLKISGYIPMNTNLINLANAAGFGMGIIAQISITINRAMEDTQYGISKTNHLDSQIPNTYVSILIMVLPFLNLILHEYLTLWTWKSLDSLKEESLSLQTLLKAKGVWIATIAHIFFVVFSYGLGVCAKASAN